MLARLNNSPPCGSLGKPNGARRAYCIYEVTQMHRFQIFGGLLLSAALLVPMTVSAAAHDKKYYDRDAKDYHTWNSQEDRAYHAYVVDQHQQYRDFKKVKPAQQQEYFKWRHEHPDSTLFKVEIR